MSLMNLPGDIWIEIASNLEQRNISSFCLSCKELYETAIHVLYQRFTLLKRQQVYSMYDLVLTNPAMGRYVRSLFLKGANAEDRKHRGIGWLPPGTTYLVGSIPNDNSDQQGEVAMNVAALIKNAPNLKHLEMAFAETALACRGGLLASFVRSCASLTTLGLSSMEDRSLGTVTCGLLRALRSPLRVLRVDHLFPDTPRFNPFTLLVNFTDTLEDVSLQVRNKARWFDPPATWSKVLRCSISGSKDISAAGLERAFPFLEDLILNVFDKLSPPAVRVLHNLEHKFRRWNQLSRVEGTPSAVWALGLQGVFVKRLQLIEDRSVNAVAQCSPSFIYGTRPVTLIVACPHCDWPVLTLGSERLASLGLRVTTCDAFEFTYKKLVSFHLTVL